MQRGQIQKQHGASENKGLKGLFKFQNCMIFPKKIYTHTKKTHFRLIDRANLLTRQIYVNCLVFVIKRQNSKFHYMNCTDQGVIDTRAVTIRQTRFVSRFLTHESVRVTILFWGGGFRTERKTF